MRPVHHHVIVRHLRASGLPALFDRRLVRLPVIGHRRGLFVARVRACRERVIFFSSLLFSGSRVGRRGTVYIFSLVFSPFRLSFVFKCPFLRGFPVVTVEVRQRDPFGLIVEVKPPDSLHDIAETIHPYNVVYVGRHNTVYMSVYAVNIEPRPQPRHFPEYQIAVHAEYPSGTHQLRLVRRTGFNFYPFARHCYAWRPCISSRKRANSSMWAPLASRNLPYSAIFALNSARFIVSTGTPTSLFSRDTL